jgi:hydroxymethylglutaryl-CoA reductase
MGFDLPPSFRKLTATQRHDAILKALQLTEIQTEFDLEWADRLVENAFGWHHLPMGLVPNFIVNGRSYQVPLVTEEPSVIAAVSYVAKILERVGGIKAESTPSLIRGQLFLEGANAERWDEARSELINLAEAGLSRMTHRGGGLRMIQHEVLPQSRLFLITFLVDVCDAQGANAMNSLLEELSPHAERLLGGRRLMAILSNNSPERLGRASFAIPVGHLARGPFSGEQMAQRLCLAWEAARECVDRAVTHNKGIMNGITALALATGNDTRALEAAVHCYASRSGRYQPLSSYQVVDDHLKATIQLPLPLATVGGGTQALPSSNLVWKILGITKAQELMELAAALGLAQNFAALMALCGEGIQHGHMQLHQKRLKTENSRDQG